MIIDLLMVNNMETWNALRLHFILSCFQLFWWYIFVFARALKCKIFTAFLLIYGEIESPGNPRSATRLPDTSLTVLTMITIQGSARTQASPPWPLTPWCLRAVCLLIITLLWPDSVSVSGSDGDPGTGPDVPRSWPPVCPRRRAPARPRLRPSLDIGAQLSTGSRGVQTCHDGLHGDPSYPRQ